MTAEFTDAVRALTPAEHRALAEADLAKMRSMTPGIEARKSLALSAIAHTLAAVAHYLDPDDVAEPEVRLPGGVVVRAQQSDTGNRFWRYVITGPGRARLTAPRYLWSTAEHALTAGTGAVAGNGNGQEAGS